MQQLYTWIKTLLLHMFTNAITDTWGSTPNRTTQSSDAAYELPESPPFLRSGGEEGEATDAGYHCRLGVSRFHEAGG
jgi:hypothetical protein